MHMITGKTLALERHGRSLRCQRGLGLGGYLALSYDDHPGGDLCSTRRITSIDNEP